VTRRLNPAIGSRVDESPGDANSENCRRERLHPAERAALQSAVLREQVRILYESPAVLLVSLTIAVLVAFSLRSFYPGWLGVAWAGLIVVISARLYDFWRYRHTPQPAEAVASWALRFTVGAIATGGLWGLIGSVLLLASDPAHLGFIAFVVAGLTAGAAVSNSAYLPAMLGFMAPIALPAILVLFSLATPMSIAMGLVAAACSAALFWLSIHTKRWITSIAKREITQTALTATLKSRSELLHAVSVAAKELLTATTVDMAMATVLETIGKAARADRMLVFENQTPPRGASAPHLRYGWHSPQAPAVVDASAIANAPEFFADPWFAPLGDGQALSAVPRNMPDGAAKSSFLRMGIQEILLVPITVDGKFWGHIGLDDCKTEREWSSVELDILRTVAEMFGAAIIRERYVEKLKDANTIVESSPTILFRLRGDPSLALIYVSHNVTKYGYDPGAMIAASSLWRSIIHPDDTARVEQLLSQLAMEGSEPATIEFRMRSKDGTYDWLECRYMPIRDASGRLLEIEGLLTNITERKKAADKIRALAMTDALTGLANRATFIDRLGQAFAAAQRGAPPFAILYLDLDRFKDINDTLGHSAGDMLLKSVSERLKSCVRETDLVARLGGDEFAVLQTNLDDVASAGVLASKIHDALSAPYPLGDTEMRITVSIGISPYMSETAGPDEMLAHADIALYRAKDEGRNQYCFHTDDLDREAHERVTLADDLRRAALARDEELELYFQPQVELATGVIVGMEALIRWNHPTLGLLQPTDFLPMVEKTPVIVTLGEWVLDHACKQMSAWREAGIAPSNLAVNLSLKQLQTGEKLVRATMQTLTKWGLSPQDLELDVTESMLAHVTLHKNSVLDRLQQLGVKIAIDDFGTQYSSLDYLKTYCVSRVKIPRSMIDAAMRDPEALAMVRAIIGLGRELGIDVVAQGVETEGQRDLLSCAPSPTKVQGFYYSAPVPAVEATELLRQGLVGPRLNQRFGQVAAQ
jgi:diguanylate cyclase (GGDEF)-like protein/PAS domain S-box-containing protein